MADVKIRLPLISLALLTNQLQPKHFIDIRMSNQILTNIVP